MKPLHTRPHNSTTEICSCPVAATCPQAASRGKELDMQRAHYQSAQTAWTQAIGETVQTPFLLKSFHLLGTGTSVNSWICRRRSSVCPVRRLEKKKTTGRERTLSWRAHAYVIGDAMWSIIWGTPNLTNLAKQVVGR